MFILLDRIDKIVEVLLLLLGNPCLGLKYIAFVSEFVDTLENELFLLGQNAVLLDSAHAVEFDLAKLVQHGFNVLPGLANHGLEAAHFRDKFPLELINFRKLVGHPELLGLHQLNCLGEFCLD